MSEPIYIPEQDASPAELPDMALTHADQADSEGTLKRKAGPKKTRAGNAEAQIQESLTAEAPPLIAGATDGQAGNGIAPEEIPDKLYFRIGEVARLAGIKPYVLRFWESEFTSLGPKKSGTGHRLYRRKDVQLVLEIKTLLYEKRYTIEGARKHLESRGKLQVVAAATAKGNKEAARKSAAAAPKGQTGLFDGPSPEAVRLESVRKELGEILKLLKA